MGRNRNKNKNKPKYQMVETQYPAQQSGKELTNIMISCEYNDSKFINFKATYIDKGYTPTKLFFSDDDPIIAWKRAYNYCVKKHKVDGIKKILIGETVEKCLTKSNYKFEKDQNGTNVIVKDNLPF